MKTFEDRNKECLASLTYSDSNVYMAVYNGSNDNYTVALN
jgi:hypothetical protein